MLCGFLIKMLQTDFLYNRLQYDTKDISNIDFGHPSRQFFEIFLILFRFPIEQIPIRISVISFLYSYHIKINTNCL